VSDPRCVCVSITHSLTHSLFLGRKSCEFSQLVGTLKKLYTQLVNLRSCESLCRCHSDSLKLVPLEGFLSKTGSYELVYRGFLAARRSSCSYSHNRTIALSAPSWTYHVNLMFSKNQGTTTSEGTFPGYLRAPAAPDFLSSTAFTRAPHGFRPLTAVQASRPHGLC
jgi:hypothetical protein